jgi:UTP--glucose-1-phosphate uridylyltransferase
VTIADAVVPVAGLGTRLLPATKSQPKEMLPVIAKPVVQYVAEELAGAGIERLLFVTGRGKGSIEDHFDSDADLVRRLREGGREELLAELAYERMGVEFLYTRQPDHRGLGDAVLRAERFVAGRSFVLALGDSIIAPPRGSGSGSRTSGIVGRLAEALEAEGAAGAVAVERVPPERAPLYGIAAPAGEPPEPGRPFSLAGVVEKPAAADAPSDLAVAARYALTPAIFDAIREIPAGSDGELGLADAIARLIDAGELVVAVELAPGERRHDVGTVAGYCRTFIELALADPRLGEELREHARALLEGEAG